MCAALGEASRQACKQSEEHKWHSSKLIKFCTSVPNLWDSCIFILFSSVKDVRRILKRTVCIGPCVLLSHHTSNSNEDWESKTLIQTEETKPRFLSEWFTWNSKLLDSFGATMRHQAANNCAEDYFCPHSQVSSCSTSKRPVTWNGCSWNTCRRAEADKLISSPHYEALV